MPLSTSNSNDRLPALPWGRLWLLTIILAVVCLVSYEMLWRWQGFVPRPSDNVGLWMLQRNKVRPHDREQVVLLGASQTQSNYDLDTFERLYGRRPVQLAICASGCLPILDQFARDESFQGIILSDVKYYAFYEGMFPSPEEERPQHNVNRYDSRTAGWWLEEEISSWIDQQFVLRQSGFSLQPMMRRIAQRQWPQLPRTIISLDRQQRYFFPKNMTVTYDKPREPLDTIHPYDPSSFYRDMGKLRARVNKITQRGGKVIFIMMPLTGYSRDSALKRYPRELFFDKLIAESGATAGVHFMDYPALRELVPPDETHLDQSDMARFTETLVGILKEKLKGK